MTTPTEELKTSIREIGVRRGGEWKISSKGELQDWLIDLRPVLLNRRALTTAAELFWARFADIGPFQVEGWKRQRFRS